MYYFLFHYFTKQFLKPHKTFITVIWTDFLQGCITVYFFFFFPPFFFPFLPFPPFPPFPPPPSSSSAWAALARFLPRGVFAYQPCKCQLKLVKFFLEYFYKCLNINDRIISCACYAASRACMTHYVTLRITLHEAFRNKHNLARWSYLSWEIVQLSS